MVPGLGSAVEVGGKDKDVPWVVLDVPPPTVFGVVKPVVESNDGRSAATAVYLFKDFILTAKYVLSSSQCTITAPYFEMRVTVPNMRSSCPADHDPGSLPSNSVDAQETW